VKIENTFDDQALAVLMLSLNNVKLVKEFDLREFVDYQLFWCL